MSIIVNLFAGPGAGKSTIAAGVFTELKFAGVDCELVREYAKDKVWEESFKTLEDQIYVFGKQLHRVKVVAEKVKVVITDSPVLLSMYYGTNVTPEFRALILSEFNSFDNMNYFISRVKPYVANGRMQTSGEALEIDRFLYDLLDDNDIGYNCVHGNREGLQVIVRNIMKRLEEQ